MHQQPSARVLPRGSNEGTQKVIHVVGCPTII
jgi:hypothetical protein